MKPLGTNLDDFLDDYNSATGKSIQHFFCPILHVDEDVQLTRGHIVPESLGGKSRVLQRADVDNGFGSFFEAEAADAIRHGLDSRPLHTALGRNPEDTKKIVRRFRLRVRFEETNQFLDAVLRNKDSRPGFHVATDKLQKALGRRKKQTDVMGLVTAELDARSSILVTALRTSHLAWFNICGYRYVFDNEGIFVAWILRSFYEKFIQPRRRPHRTRQGSLVSQQVKDEVNDYCLQFANLIRPLPASLVDRYPEQIRRGTPDTGWFIALWDSDQIYGRISIIKLGDQHLGVLTPTTTDARGWALIDLAANLEFQTSYGRFDAEDGIFRFDPPNQQTIWPAVNTDSTPPISIQQAARIVIDSGRMNSTE